MQRAIRRFALALATRFRLRAHHARAVAFCQFFTRFQKRVCVLIIHFLCYFHCFTFKK